MGRIVGIWRAHPVLGSLFGLAALITVLFALRAVVFFIAWSDPDRHRQPVEPWMTPRYVARSWHIPPEEMPRILELPAESVERRRISLEELAAEAGLPVETLIERIDAHTRARDEAGTGTDR